MYTINKLAQLAGVTLRTLRHYDDIGLLPSSVRTESGYRLYSDEDVERLQQILFFRELDFSLPKIKEIIQSPTFDRQRALEMQIDFLEKKAERYAQLSQLAKNTLNHLQGGTKMENQDMFNEFSYDNMVEHQKKYEKEVEERWGNSDAYKISKERTSKMSKEDWERIGAEQSAGLKELCELFQAKVPHDDERVQAAVKAGHMFIHNNFYPCSLEIFSNLGNMYVMDERFTVFYDKHAVGLAAYYNEAIQHYCIVNA